MIPFAQCPAHALRQVRGVFTDIDDTLTTDGAITPDALQALHDLHAAGIEVIPITGRPIGWAEPFAKTWPVRAIVAENGAVAWVKALAGGQNASTIPILNENTPVPLYLHDVALSKIYQQHAGERVENYARLQACLADIEQSIPGAQRATDSAGRETDIAVDHSEFTHLSEAQIDAVVKRMQAHGLRATVSSIHINGWIGEHDKLAGARWIARALLDRDLEAELNQWLYIGDSTNDQVMFAHLPLSLGVANIARFASQLSHPPRYVTAGERGAGFAEVAQRLLRLLAPTD